ncbi:MAG: type 1 glutamine amidotransferase [Marinovum sp.]|jgi:GMP synthase-like glutamine amidotransferase|nr:type 1 glutamine amidotransferase [Marinovum sp.]MBT7908637.1 type 1 glutamine amidotransferase [Marinovum sp.]
MQRIKLGILQTNHDKSVEVGDAFPDDSHRFRDMFDAQDDRFKYTIYMTIGGEVPHDLDEQDAFLITGSPLSVLDHHVFTDDLMDFIRRCDYAKKPLMGACFGHQAIALALGGRVEKSKDGYSVGVEDTVYNAKRSWMKPNRDHLSMYVFHEDAVTELPEGCDLLGSTVNCKNASFAKGTHIFTTQAHPEFSNDFMSCVLRFAESSIPAEGRKAAWDSLERDEEGYIFGLWTTQFFKEAMKNV